MDFKKAINYINDLCRFGINLGLERTKVLLSLAGDPDKNLYIIHVAGTNGKGSTSAMLRAALVSAGFKVGLYTSPHLHSYRERIQINGRNISEEEFARMTNSLKNNIDHNREKISGEPTEFEFLTVLAASYFAEKDVDFAIFEVGLGGRLDSTNALKTDLSIITNIGFDHQEILGGTIPEIAAEKAKIIRKNGNTVVGIQDFSEAEKVMLEEIAKKNARAIWAKEIPFNTLASAKRMQSIFLKNSQEIIYLNLKGTHQIHNLLNVVSAYDFLSETRDIDRRSFLEGFSKVEWPGRLEEFCFQDRNILIDGAHNPQGARKLSDYLKEECYGKRIFFLMGILDDKDKKGIFDELYELATSVFISKPAGSRTNEWNRLPEGYQEKDNIFLTEDPKEALKKVIGETTKDDLIVSCGSFYFISEIREQLIKKQ